MWTDLVQYHYNFTGFKSGQTRNQVAFSSIQGPVCKCKAPDCHLLRGRERSCILKTFNIFRNHDTGQVSNRATQLKEVPSEQPSDRREWATEQKKEVLKDVIIDGSRHVMFKFQVIFSFDYGLCLKTLLGLKFKFNIYIQLKYLIKTLL